VLVDELSTIKSVTDITAVEDDPYTAYILDKLFKPVISGDKKVTYISGDGALDPSILSTGRIFDTVILSCARVKPGKYGRKYLEKIRDNFLKPGGELVINISHSNADEIFVAVKGLFKAISMSQGVIIAK
jgi:spermidine synthase